MPDKETASQRVRVFIEDHTGNKSVQARVAADAEVQQLLPALITALELPVTDPSGRAITYHLALGDTRLEQDATLASVNVQDGATLTLIPEMTAGAPGGARRGGR